MLMMFPRFPMSVKPTSQTPSVMRIAMAVERVIVEKNKAMAASALHPTHRNATNLANPRTSSASGDPS